MIGLIVPVKEVPILGIGDEPILIEFRDDLTARVVSNPYIDHLPEPVQKVHPLGVATGIFGYDDFMMEEVKWEKRISRKRAIDNVMTFLNYALTSLVAYEPKRATERKDKYHLVHAWLAGERQDFLIARRVRNVLLGSIVGYYYGPVLRRPVRDWSVLQAVIDLFDSRPDYYDSSVGTAMITIIESLPKRSRYRARLTRVQKMCADYYKLQVSLGRKPVWSL